MKIKDIKEKYYFENLTEEHDLSEFDCGDEDLNNFLKDDALTQQKAMLNVTKLIMFEGKIIGYASILTDSISLKDIKNEELKIEIKEKLGIKKKKITLPGVKIGRLAIDKEYTGKGLGTHIMDSILGNLKLKSENDIGFRFIIVDGYVKAFNFYVIINGFEYLAKDQKYVNNIEFIKKTDPTKKLTLYFDLEDFPLNTQKNKINLGKDLSKN